MFSFHYCVIKEVVAPIHSQAFNSGTCTVIRIRLIWVAFIFSSKFFLLFLYNFQLLSAPLLYWLELFHCISSRHCSSTKGLSILLLVATLVGIMYCVHMFRSPSKLAQLTKTCLTSTGQSSIIPLLLEFFVSILLWARKVASATAIFLLLSLVWGLVLLFHAGLTLLVTKIGLLALLDLCQELDVIPLCPVSF